MKKNLLMIFSSLFCVSLVVSNIIAGKLFSAPFGLVLPAAVFLFPVVYILGDVIPEVYGLKVAKNVIWLGFATNLFAVLIFLLTLSLQYPPFWGNQDAFQAVLGNTPRLLIASFAAYLVGTNVNAQVLVFIKKLTNGKFLWLRTIGSTLVGESLDSAIFITAAFLGIIPTSQLPMMIFAQASFKILYEVAATPLTYLVVGYVKKFENEDSVS
jgi:uncharacterized integral membrane protein (TIGR00697 family)